MAGILYAICGLTCLGGGLYLVSALSIADSAPQQAAASAMVMAWVVITYCLARSVSETRSLRQREKLLKALGEPEEATTAASTETPGI